MWRSILYELVIYSFDSFKRLIDSVNVALWMNLWIIDSLDPFKWLIHLVNGSLYELIFESLIHSIRSK